MDKKFICGGKKFELGGPKEDTIGLPVAFSNLPEKIEIEGYTLFLKTTFHISLVCVGKIIEKYNISIPNFLDKVIADFCDFTKNNKIDLIRYRNEFRFMSENERRTVVVMCDVSNLTKFFDYINKKYNTRIEYPPTHVTLYTLQPNLGIFMIDSSDMKRLTKPLENSGLIIQ
jgi:hypothetical protein